MAYLKRIVQPKNENDYFLTTVSLQTCMTFLLWQSQHKTKETFVKNIVVFCAVTVDEKVMLVWNDIRVRNYDRVSFPGEVVLYF